MKDELFQLEKRQVGYNADYKDALIDYDFFTQRDEFVKEAMRVTIQIIEQQREFVEADLKETQEMVFKIKKESNKFFEK